MALDASVLLGGRRSEIVGAAALRFYDGFWSAWTIGEFVRKRTEWVADRAVRDGCSRAELRRRLRDSRERVNRLVTELSGVLHLVNHTAAPSGGLDWLRDRDDWPVMETALAARAGILVTENSRDFPIGSSHNGVLFLTGERFLTRLYHAYPDAEDAIRALAGRR